MQSGYLEEPGLPGVPLLEPEAFGVSREPVIGLRWAKVELGPVAVEALPRRRHVLGIRVLRVQLGLLGVRAKGLALALGNGGALLRLRSLTLCSCLLSSPFRSFEP